MSGAGHPKRAWKLQEFVAHSATVNCLALGHKSGRVLVTGGDDKKVNLWAVGKPNCIMSLPGHTTAVECVRFGHTEELVCAGSASGALKIWDLEAARLVRTLTGHKSGIKCIDFHPYGDFLSSGSSDTNLKLWDIRRKGCIFTYKGHSQQVNSLKFSPDGQWVASGGEEGAVKIWDLRAGKLMTEFADHAGPVHDVEFHPHEFLLASASQDRTVKFWDLETFQLISTADKDTGPVRCISFHPEGNCLFSGSQDSLRVHGWEPTKVHDMVVMGWGKIRDVAFSSSQLVGAAAQMSNVSLYIVDLKRVQPFGFARPAVPGSGIVTVVNTGGSGTEFRTGQHVRRSFIKEKPDQNGMRPRPDVKISEDASSDKSGTDPEDSSDNFSQADITDYQNYEQVILPIFRPRMRELNRTPPIPPYLEFQAPDNSDVEQGPPIPHQSRNFSADILDHLSPLATRSQSLNRTPTAARTVPEITPLTPVSRIQITQQQQAAAAAAAAGVDKPLDRPTLVRPQRTAVIISQQQQHALYDDDLPTPGSDHKYGRQNSPPVLEMTRYGSVDHMASLQHQQQQQQQSQPLQQRRYMSSTQQRKLSQQQQQSAVISPFGQRPSVVSREGGLDSDCPTSPAPEKVDIIPMNMDKPSGLPLNDFLPRKFQNLSLDSPMSSDNNGSKFSAYKSYCQPSSELSEAEVTSSILKGHESMMTVLANRGRQLEIIHKLWQSKDAKTAVDHAVSLNDQSVVVDVLSVITLRPSIWNLDLCVSLLPSIGDLMQSKYESYINVGCGAMKLILKNFASVIKSNIDSPVQTVGVDISREERHNKCMQCYKDLVKIRSLILKRQTIQGKLGHVFRELSILMQYLD